MHYKNEKRRDEIMKKLSLHHEIKVKELAQELQVTNETIRLDLLYLEKKGVIYRIHGGAILREDDIEIPFDIRKQEQGDIKKALAYKTIEYIANDSVLFIASSSTNLYLGRLLSLKKNLTIFTNSIDLVLIMKETKHNLFLVGGQYYNAGKRTIGQYALDMIKDIHFDICICSMDGCLGLHGPATKSFPEHVFIRHIIEQSHKKILISDNTKFTRYANYKYAKFSDFDLLITNKLDEDIKKDVEVKRILEVHV